MRLHGFGLVISKCWIDNLTMLRCRTWYPSWSTVMLTMIKTCLTMVNHGHMVNFRRGDHSALTSLDYESRFQRLNFINLEQIL